MPFLCPPSSAEDRTGIRAVNLDVTGRAVSVLRIQVMLRALRLLRADAVILAVAFQAELRNGASL